VLLGLAVLWLSGAGCSLTGPIHGQVLDARTGQPVPGAIVLGVWTTREGVPGLYATKLVDVREVEVDAQGRFTLERPLGMILEGDESLTVYKFGYLAWNNLFLFPLARRKGTGIPETIRLEEFPAGGSSQEHMSFVHLAGSDQYGIERIPKFWKAIQSEMDRARRERK
jgi:hypothetical protein